MKEVAVKVQALQGSPLFDVSDAIIQTMMAGYSGALVWGLG